MIEHIGDINILSMFQDKIKDSFEKVEYNKSVVLK